MGNRNDTMLGWHTLNGGKLAYDEKNVRMPKIGERVEMRPKDRRPVLCCQGMHAGHALSEAFRYAPDEDDDLKESELCLVFIQSSVESNGTKACGRYRTIIKRWPWPKVIKMLEGYDKNFDPMQSYLVADETWTSVELDLLRDAGMHLYGAIAK